MARMKCRDCKCEYGLGLFNDEEPHKKQKMGVCPDCKGKQDLDELYKWKPFGTDLKEDM